MISTMMYQLMQDATIDEIIAAGLGGYYTCLLYTSLYDANQQDKGLINWYFDGRIGA